MENHVIESEIGFGRSDWIDSLYLQIKNFAIFPQVSFTFYVFLKLRVIGLSLISDTNILNSFCSLSSPEFCSK